ncbi:PEP-CTERM sorting domain-containing protein [Synechocystis sp. PCC 7509]|uniref:PEP-CTERM sorting domain-containing protein n=1 Tax=Synechocystis sp. PCC 7509 TaxID=927677 RepID=UPI0002AC95B9|nr:PEP-CTERM sorting domain-containing protein [Synechocystis sp. PCC 7509]
MATNESSISNFFVGNGNNNPYSNGGGSSNPFAGGGSPLTDGDISKFFADGENPFANGDIYNLFANGENPFTNGENPFGANQDLGSNNATIGNGNWNLSSNNAVIGNGNWNIDSASYNGTIGNGNWLRDEASYNSTIGNGNWYWNSSSKNSTLGNGNWSFGKDNSTIGNGNWNFGKNNVIIGNGNWLFTDNNVIIGNGNWFLDGKSTASQNIDTLKTLFPELKSDVDSLVGSIMGEFGKEFTGFTTDFDAAQSKTLEQLILSQGNGSTLESFSESDLSQFFASLNGISGDFPKGDPRCFIACPDSGGSVPTKPVPEPSSALSLLGLGLVYFLWAKKFKAKEKLKLNN